VQRSRALRAHRFLTRSGPLTWAVPKFTVHRFGPRITGDGPAGRLSAFLQTSPACTTGQSPPHHSVSRALFICWSAATLHREDCGPHCLGEGGTLLATCTAAAERLGARRVGRLAAPPSPRCRRCQSRVQAGRLPHQTPRTAASLRAVRAGDVRHVAPPTDCFYGGVRCFRPLGGGFGSGTGGCGVVWDAPPLRRLV